MLFKKRLTKFYATVLQEKGENVKILAQDMKLHINQKQIEVSDYANYLNRAYNRLIQEKVEEYENARELYNKLQEVLLSYSQCDFEIRVLQKKKQDVYLEQKLCNTRNNMIKKWKENCYHSIDECKNLIQLINGVMADTQFNYLILFQNQELLKITPEYIEEFARTVKYNDLQKELYKDGSDDATKKAYFAAKTVIEELSIYQKEAGLLKIIKKQLYERMKDCKKGEEVFKQVSSVLKQRMDGLKSQQQYIQDRKKLLYKDAEGIWRSYFSKSKECIEFDNRISIVRQDIDLLQKKIERIKERITDKKARKEVVKSTQRDIKSKKEELIQANKLDEIKKQEYISRIKEIKERKRVFLATAAKARERKYALCQEHKNLSRIVKLIKMSHKHDPDFSNKIVRLNSLSHDIEKAQSENDAYMKNVEYCNSQYETVQQQINYYQANQNRRSQEIDKYKVEQKKLSTKFNILQEEIDTLKYEIEEIREKKQQYYEKIRVIQKEKNGYINMKFSKLMELCQGLLEV